MATHASNPRDRRVATLTLCAEVAATLAVAVWLGGMLALGALAAPTVFAQLEPEVAGQVMGTIFSKFDRVVLALIGILVVAEGVRVWVEGMPSKLAIARFFLAGILVILALISALWLGPSINELFEAGVRRGVGDAGAEMDQLHNWAERLGKAAFAFAAVWLTLGIILHRRAVSDGPASEGPHPL